MQPCSQPRYGLIDWLNGISGELLRAMMVRARSTCRVVCSFGGSGLVRRDGRCGQRFEIRFPFVARESPLLVR